MKFFPFISATIASTMTIASPTVMLAHPGHGDEFKPVAEIQ
jgi:hypothetical protein